MAANFARRLLSFDPTEAITQVTVPVLVLNGNRDIQVDSTLDAQPLYDAAIAAGVDAELAICEQADHVLKTELAPREELTAMSALIYNSDQRVLDPDVISAVVTWLQAH